MSARTGDNIQSNCNAAPLSPGRAQDPPLWTSSSPPPPRPRAAATGAFLVALIVIYKFVIGGFLLLGCSPSGALLDCIRCVCSQHTQHLLLLAPCSRKTFRQGTVSDSRLLTAICSVTWGRQGPGKIQPDKGLLNLPPSALRTSLTFIVSPVTRIACKQPC